MKRIPKVLLVAVVLIASWAGSARAFTQQQIARLDQAEKDMQVMFHMLRADAAPGTVQIPPEVEPYLPAMERRMVWRDPDEGLLSEAKLWQSPASLLYEFYEITRRTYPQDQGGTGEYPNFLARQYEDVRFRFQLAVDRLYKARLQDSFGGRGRAALGSLDLILHEMDSLITALSGGAGSGLSKQQLQEYQRSVMAIGDLTEASFHALSGGERGPDAPAPEGVSKAAGAFPFMTALLGMGAIFFAVYLFMRLNDEWVGKKVQDYQSSSKASAESYRKQFLDINVNLLIGVPVAFFMLLGALTFSLPLFILFTLVGAYIGKKTPDFVLDIMREARGRRVEGQLMDSLILMSNSLKSGKDISQAFDMVSKEMRPPIADEFGLMMRNYQLGTPFEDAMRGMEDRVTSKLLSYMIKAIMIQRQVGGNLTKIFDRIVENIREESKLEQKVGALTAQQKIQSVVVGIAPIVMVSIMFFLQPDTMIKFYGSPIGVIVALFCVGWLSVGMIVTNKMSKVEV